MGTKWNVDLNGNLKLAGDITDQIDILSIDVNNRKLYASDGSTLNLNYDVPGVIDFGFANLINVGSIAPSSPIPPDWTLVIVNTQTLTINKNYVLDCPTPVAITLPGIAPFGSEIKIQDDGGNGFIINLPSGNFIKLLNVSTSSGGSVNTLDSGCSMYLVCIVANTTWRIFSCNGNFNLL